jgi:hypothetical protein
MSNEISTAMVAMFNANVMHLSQQKESRLLPYVRRETQRGESEFFDLIGKVEMEEVVGRHQEVVYTDTPHSRRRVTTSKFKWSDLVDKSDKLKTIMNPESEYAKAAAGASGRRIDSEIIDAALGSAWTGKAGATEVVLPDTQKIVAFDGTKTTGCGLNVQTLRAVRKMAKQAEAIAKGEQMIFAMAAQQADDLLSSTEVTNSDYSAVKALVNGEVDTFMGFKFIETELLPFTSAIVYYNSDTGAILPSATDGTLALGAGRRCFAFTANRGVILSFLDNPVTKMDIMPKYFHSTQILHTMELGGVRMEEEQVIEVMCLES